MTGHIDAERILDAFLAPEHDQLADRVVDAALDRDRPDPTAARPARAVEVPPDASTPSLCRRRAVVLVAVVGVGGALFFTSAGGAGRRCGRARAHADADPRAHRRPHPRRPRSRRGSPDGTPTPLRCMGSPSATRRLAVAGRGHAPVGPVRPVAGEDSPWADSCQPARRDGDPIALWVYKMQGRLRRGHLVARGSGGMGRGRPVRSAGDRRARRCRTWPSRCASAGSRAGPRVLVSLPDAT